MNYPTLPSGNFRVTVYGGPHGMFSATLVEALAFAQCRVADGFREPLILGRMREGCLGREMVTVADLELAVAQ